MHPTQVSVYFYINDYIITISSDFYLTLVGIFIISFTLVKKSWMNQENTYSNDCEVKYLLKEQDIKSEMLGSTWKI